MIEISGVSKLYNRRRALDDVSLTIHPGEVTLLLGANGAGKSTLLRCLLGITEFDGTILVDGVEPLRRGPEVRALIGYMPQAVGLHADRTVEETLWFYADVRRVPRERCVELVREAGLAEQAATLVGDLSGGMRQRLGFALALLTDPRILVLDEPSASLDAASRGWLAGRLRAAAAEGRTVLVSTHVGQELLAAGDRRITLEDGRLVSDERLNPRTAVAASRPSHGAAGSLRPLVEKEILDAIGSRWLLSYAIVLGLLGLAAAITGIGSSTGLALQAYGRTTATLMNLCLLLSPLVAVLMGAASIAAERERGTLEPLLAQPLTRTGLVLAKHAGLLLSLTAATVAGFLPAGVLIVWHSGPGVLAHYALFPAVASLVGAALLGLGMLISVTSRSAVHAQGTAVFAWFALVLLYDLVLMGALGMSGLPVGVLAAALVSNPVDAARVLGVLSLEPDLYLLGPAGAYLTARLSRGGTAILLLGSLGGWAAAPLAAAIVQFRVRPRGKPHTAAVTAIAPRSHGEVTV